MTELEKLYQSLNGAERDYFLRLCKIAGEVRPTRILEIGTGWGLSAVAFLLSSNAALCTIDKSGLDNLRLFNERIDLFNLWPRIKMFTGDSKEILPTIGERFDLAYIDGDHTWEGAKSDLDLVGRKLIAGGVILVDDVFHRLNWQNRESGRVDGEFGVAKALGEWLLANEKQAIIYPEANGIARIDL